MEGGPPFAPTGVPGVVGWPKSWDRHEPIVALTHTHISALVRLVQRPLVRCGTGGKLARGEWQTAPMANGALGA